MNLATLQSLMKVKGMNQSELARMAGVSRQSVSLWFGKAGDWGRQINIHSRHLHRISKSLGVSMDALMEPLFPNKDLSEYFKSLEKTLTWDGAYSDLISFVVALVIGDDRAYARLVQIFGLFSAAKIAGDEIWHRFSRYKKYMNPTRRKESEKVWELQKDLGLI